MKCKKCRNEHDGSYGSGKFCSRSCANSRVFSEKSKKKKSDSNKQRVKQHGKWGSQIAHVRDLKGSSIKCKKTWVEKLMKESFEDLSYDRKRKRIILEQDGRCDGCKIGEWRGKPLTLEIDHINGNNKDNRRENMVGICPNCHSITSTWRGRNRSNNKLKLSGNEIYDLYLEKGNIRQTLLAMGLAAKGDNYRRVKRVIERFENKTK